MSRLRTTYKEIAICIIPVIVIALLARVATGTFSLPEIFLGQSTRSATLIAQAKDATLIQGQKHNLWLEIENTGPSPWTHGGADAILLESSKLISDPWYAEGSTWLSQNKIALWEDEVPVGGRGHFIFTILADQDPGKYTAKFNVVDANLKPLKGMEPANWKVNVEQPKYGFELAGAAVGEKVIPGRQVSGWARYKNTGNTVWKNYGEHPLALALTDPEAVTSLAVANRWPDRRRVAWLDQPEVAPGEEGTFTFTLQIPDDFKQQEIVFQPEFESLDVADIPTVKLELAAGQGEEVKLPTPQSGEATNFASADDLNLTVVAAEHGDCYIVRLPSGQVLVFDTAHPSRANVVVDALRRQGVTKIDYLFLSHPHWDHIGGAPEILNNFEVDQVYINGEGYPFATYAELAQSLEPLSSRVKLVARGEVIELENEARLEILHPLKTLSGISADDEAVNNNTLVARLVFGDAAILLPGDIYQASMKELVDSGIDLSATVLALPHHGNDGFGEAEQSFLEAMNPRVVVKSSSWAEWQEQTSLEMRKFLDGRAIRLLPTAELGELNITLSPAGNIKVTSGSFVWK